MAQSNISKEKDFRSKVMKYFVNGKATLKYREIAKLAGCSLGMVSYYKDPERAIQKINENSGRTEWHKVWAYLFRSRGKKQIRKETFTTLLRKKGRAFLYGLGALGKKGVTKALDIIKTEADMTMALCGKRDIHDLNRDNIYTPK